MATLAFATVTTPEVETGTSDGQGGAVSVQHRFGGALNLNCHVHAAVIDGVFTRHDESERATFHAVPAPDSFAPGNVIERVYGVVPEPAVADAADGSSCATRAPRLPRPNPRPFRWPPVT